MSLFGSPAPQWLETNGAALASRLAPVLDASGFWVLLSSGAADGAFEDDPSGFTVIDDTTTIGLRPTLLPNEFVITY